MPEIIVTTRAGETVSLDGKPGATLMECIRDAGIDELLALCGGCCSCATCHVYLDLDPAGQAPAITLNENDLLDALSCRRETSRLSCQIQITNALQGLQVTIGPE